MLLGPVFHAELLTTARRARYYLARVVYGLALLAVLWSGYRRVQGYVEARGSDELSIGEMTDFARTTFGGFVSLQAATIILLTPALVAPVIASEKSRKTMHYLLCSRLNSAEIVLGKLGARLLMLAVILALGVPVLSLLQLFGGIEAREILQAYLALGALLVFLAGTSVLVSTVTAEPRRAVFFGYAAPVLFLAFPFVLKLLLFRFPGVQAGVSEALSWLLPLPRRALVPETMAVNYTAGNYEQAERAEMIRCGVVATLYGVLFMALAVMLVRPVGRREEKQKRVELRIDRRGRWHWRVLPRPPVGDDAMLWKERFTSRWGGAAKIAALLVHLFVAALIGCFLWELVRDSARELQGQGFVPGDWEGAREQFNQFIRTVSMLTVGLWMLGTAAVAAGSITTERESDTWVSLLSTPLTGLEIVRAKLLGSVVRFKWLGVMLGLLWLVGAGVGAIHPLGLLLALAELPIFLGFAAALGVACSLESKTTTRALALTLGLLGFLNGGYLLALYGEGTRDREAHLGGVAPWAFGTSLASYPDINRYHDVLENKLFNTYRVYFQSQEREPEPLSRLKRGSASILTAIPLYLLGGLLLASVSVFRFDRVSDRPGAGPGRASDLPASEQRKRFAT
jgi:ABC-type transport system involved in multi-copper enzyme maturation permease subunit